MPRDLSDVLHFFLPELDGDRESPPGASRPFARKRVAADGAARRPGASRNAEASRLPLSVLGVPLGDRDVVHAAYVWNLARETLRLGGTSAIVTPEGDRDGPLWSVCTSGAAGDDVEIVYSAACDLAGLRHDAEKVARDRGRSADGGIVFTRIPPAWLGDDPSYDGKPADNGRSRGDDAIRWLLVFTSPRPRAVDPLIDRVRDWARGRPGLEIGVTIHGVCQIEEARAAFDELARSCDERLGLPLASYGLLIDDLELFRSIAAGRPIHEADREAPAARCLTDVARLLYEDARSRVLG